MSRIKFLFLALMCVWVSSCSIFKPFVDRRRNAGVSNPALLYSGTSKSDAPAEYSELQTMADEECKKNGTGTKAVFDHETTFTCKLFLPSRIYFKCEK